MILLFIILALLSLVNTNNGQLDTKFSQFVSSNSIMGFAVEITRNSNTIYKGNFGFRDIQRNLQITNTTYFRVASLSKSMTTSGLFLLIQQGKLKLTDTINELVGFPIINPFYPQINLTVQMVLSHRSGLRQCSVYDNFLADTDITTNGTTVPKLKDFFIVGGKYYNNCSFDKDHIPGTYYFYGNINYIIIGNIIEKLTNERFDIWMKSNLLSKIGGLSHNPAFIPDINDLSVLYAGLNNRFYPTHDNYQGNYTPRQLSDYIPGTNAAIYGPHAHVRASVTQLCRYINMIRQNGVLNGTRILKSSSVQQIIRPRYQYHGLESGRYNDLHTYGFGIYTTGYYKNDMVLQHKVTRGHTGNGYGLISGYYYWNEFAFAYAINGILNGYTYNTQKITQYQVERQNIHKIVDEYISSLIINEVQF